MSFQYRGLSAQLTRHIVTPGGGAAAAGAAAAAEPPELPLSRARPSRLGDELVLDYAGYCDGKQFEGGTAQNQTLVLGSGAFIPGFEEQLVDKGAGGGSGGQGHLPHGVPRQRAGRKGGGVPLRHPGNPGKDPLSAG